jgi:hypothetical protein
VSERSLGWAASLAAHLVLAVELGTFGLRIPERGDSKGSRFEVPVDRVRTRLPEVRWNAAHEPESAASPEPVPPQPLLERDGTDDHNESADDADANRVAPVEAPGLGLRRPRAGAMRVRVRPPRTTATAPPPGEPEGVDGVLEALKWLSRHQGADGSWSVAGGCIQCLPNPGDPSFSVGVTGLAVLAFLGASYSHLSADTYDGVCFGRTLRSSLRWLVEQQGVDGSIGPRDAAKPMYNHLLGTLALVEAYGLTGSSHLQEPARRALDFTLAARNPGQAWRYQPRGGDNDSSVTGWALLVLRSAEQAELPVPRAAWEGIRAWIDEVTEEAYGRAGYTHKGTGKVFTPGIHETFDHHETTSAIGALARIRLKPEEDDPILPNAIDLLLRDRPSLPADQLDYAYGYFATRAIHHYDARPSGPAWKAWAPELQNTLGRLQNRTPGACRRGSWEPADRWSPEGGRVYATAINALTLQVYDRRPSCQWIAVPKR